MIVVDVQAVQSIGNGERGIARYVGEVARALARRGGDVVDVYAWNDALPFVPRLDELGLGDRLRPYSELRGRRADLLHIGSPFELMPYGDFRVPVRPDRTIATCFDLIPYRFPEAYLRDPMERARYQARLSLLLGADEIVTDSESAASDVASLLGYPRSRLTSIGAGVSEQFQPPTTSLEHRISTLRTRFASLRPGFVLLPTGMDWRKNTTGAMRAFSRLPQTVREDHQLVVACRATDEQLARLHQLAADLRITEHILFTGLVTDEELVLLYQSAELVFFPSFYEGFGLPVLEARRCGARVICSNTSSLPEVLTDPAATFNPHDQGEMAALLERALVDADTASFLASVPDPGFSWDRTADDLVAVYRRALDRRPRTTSIVASDPDVDADRRRVGVAIDLGDDPDDARVADLVRLLSELDMVADVTAFVASGASGQVGRLPVSVEPLSVLSLVDALGDLDSILYLCDEVSAPGLASSIQLVPGHLVVGAPCRGEPGGDRRPSTVDASRSRAGRDVLRHLQERSPSVSAASFDHAADLLASITSDRGATAEAGDVTNAVS